MYLGVELLGHRVFQRVGPVAGRVSGRLHIPAPGFSPCWFYSTSSDRSNALSPLPSVLKESLRELEGHLIRGQETWTLLLTLPISSYRRKSHNFSEPVYSCIKMSVWILGRQTVILAQKIRQMRKCMRIYCTIAVDDDY